MSTSETPNEQTHHKLLLQLIFKSHKRFFKKTKYWVQNKPYKFGLKVKNIDDKASPVVTIKNLSFGSAEGVTISQDHSEEFSVQVLNPGQEIDMWWPEPMAPVIKGSSWVECKLVPEEANQFIKTYQFNKFSQKPEIYRGGNNLWGDAISIRGEMEEEQSKTNFLLLILTILMFADGVWGLDEIAKFFVKSLGWLLSIGGEILLNLK